MHYGLSAPRFVNAASEAEPKVFLDVRALRGDIVAHRNEISCDMQLSRPVSDQMDAAALFRDRVRGLIRALGVLDEARTPCGVDVSVREAYALDAIAAAEATRRPLSQSALQVELGIDKSNVTRVVQQLAADGRVEQRAAASDGRVRLLYLTAKGRRLARTVEDQSLRRFAAVIARMSAEDRDMVLRALEVFRAALESEARDDES